MIKSEALKLAIALLRTVEGTPADNNYGEAAAVLNKLYEEKFGTGCDEYYRNSNKQLHIYACDHAGPMTIETDKNYIHIGHTPATVIVLEEKEGGL